MIVRVRGREGVTRIEVDSSDTLADLYGMVKERVAEAADCVEFNLTADPHGASIIPKDPQRSLGDCAISNGQMVFLHVAGGNNGQGETETETGQEERETEDQNDALDEWLQKQSGQITRPRNVQYCHHGPSGMCAHCQPLEPYDAKYMEERGIKHLSFHAWLRKIGVENPKNGTLRPSLEEPDYRVKSDCGRHAPYPKGICSSCQPSAISLNPQPYRLTDHVEFSQSVLVDRFLSAWRASGYQRFGWLYGRYEAYDEVPLGIKAKVEAIYEPPQDGSVDGFMLLDDPKEALVEEAARLLGLVRVGMIYTDLRDDGTRMGKVETRRGADTFFLSSTECLFIADQQIRHPASCRYAKKGHFGSRFVTVVLTGDDDNAVGVFAYQVSLSAMGMLRADLVRATTDPSQMMVVPSTSTHYVPDIIFKKKTEGGGELQTMAKPTFPVDYLIVSLSHGFPLQATPLLRSSSPFSPTSYPVGAHVLSRHLLPIPTQPERLLQLLSDFNLFVAFVALNMEKSDLCTLAKAIRENDPLDLTAFTQSISWRRLLDEMAPRQTISGSRDSPLEIDDADDIHDSAMDLDESWTCPHCTFINLRPTADQCEVCSLPRQW